MKHYGLKILILLFISVFANSGYGQYLKIESAYNITKSKGDDLVPSWSKDSKQIVFQSNRNGNWDIFQYDLLSDTIIQLTNTIHNEQYPVMLEKPSRLVYTSDSDNEEHIYYFDLLTGKEEPVMKREINGKAASFPDSEYLFYCLGYDELLKKWGLYRYEFKYNSLKYILPLSSDSHLPKVSDDGEYILYVARNYNNTRDVLNIINWYGNNNLKVSDYNFSDVSWYPGGLKIIFVSDKDNKEGEIYTIWKDGSHLERLTEDELSIKNPVISPDGKYLAVSVLATDYFDLFIIPLEDY